MTVNAGQAISPDVYNDLLDDVLDTHEHVLGDTAVLSGSVALPWGGVSSRAITDERWAVHMMPAVLPTHSWPELVRIGMIQIGSAGTACAFQLGEMGYHALRASVCAVTPRDASGEANVIPVFIADNPPGAGSARIVLRVEVSEWNSSAGAFVQEEAFLYPPPPVPGRIGTPFAMKIGCFKPGKQQLISCAVRRDGLDAFVGRVMCAGIILQYLAK